MTSTPHDIWLDAARKSVANCRRLIDAAVIQLTDDELFTSPSPNAISVANILRHLGGNLKSRWTDFLTTDGEKPDRHRDQEFANWEGDRASLLAHFDAGWTTLVKAIDSMDEKALGETIYIRGEPHSVPMAVTRSLNHLSYHVGQIMLVARTIHQGDWQWITIPPQGSEKYNEKNWGNKK